MAYTTTSAPTLIGRPGYSAEHYDFAFSGLGLYSDLGGQFEDAERAVRLAKSGQYKLAASVVNRQPTATAKNYVLTFIKSNVTAEQYREVFRHVSSIDGAGGGGFSAGKAWDFIKGSLTGGGAPASAGGGGPNYLLWGGVAAGGLILVLLLTKKPKRAPAPAPVG